MVVLGLIIVESHNCRVFETQVSIPGLTGYGMAFYVLHEAEDGNNVRGIILFASEI